MGCKTSEVQTSEPDTAYIETIKSLMPEAPVNPKRPNIVWNYVALTDLQKILLDTEEEYLIGLYVDDADKLIVWLEELTNFDYDYYAYLKKIDLMLEKL